MKVIWLAPASSIHTVKWIRSLKDAGIDLVVISLHEAHPEYPADVPLYKISPAPPWGYFIGASRVREIIKKEKPDFVHTHYASGYGTLARMSRITRHLLSVWGDDVYQYADRGALNRWNLKLNLAAADHITSTSEAMRKRTESLMSVKHPIHLTPFGVDTDLFAPVAPTADQTSFTVGIFKHLHPNYGIDRALECLAIFKKLNPEISLKAIIAGSGPSELALKKHASTLGLSETVDWTGPLLNSEVALYLQKIDVVLNLSHFESYGVAILEALAAEKPVIATNVGGVSEVLPASAGFLVRPDDILSEVPILLSSLAKNPEERLRLGRAGREFVASKFSASSCTRKMIEVYHLMAEGQKQ